MKIKINPLMPEQHIGKKVYVNWLIPNDDWILNKIFGSKAEVQNKYGEKKVVHVADIYREL